MIGGLPSWTTCEEFAGSESEDRHYNLRLDERAKKLSGLHWGDYLLSAPYPNLEL
jgi:hypothetical protein